MKTLLNVVLEIETKKICFQINDILRNTNDADLREKLSQIEDNVYLFRKKLQSLICNLKKESDIKLEKKQQKRTI